jgi:hypothetical protein
MVVENSAATGTVVMFQFDELSEELLHTPYPSFPGSYESLNNREPFRRSMADSSDEVVATRSESRGSSIAFPRVPQEPRRGMRVSEQRRRKYSTVPPTEQPVDFKVVAEEIVSSPIETQVEDPSGKQCPSLEQLVDPNVAKGSMCSHIEDQPLKQYVMMLLREWSLAPPKSV